jgi:hypothetical protein
MNEVTISIEAEPWYRELIDDIDGLITEAGFAARWTLVQAYHTIGTRILEEYPNFERREIYGGEIAKRISESIGKGERTVQKAIQFAKMWPDLDLLPEGKDVSWHKICNKYLPKPSGKEKEEYLLCKCCGSENVGLMYDCTHCHTKFEFKKEDIRKR